MKLLALLLVVAYCEAASFKTARVEAPYPTAGYPQGPALNLPGEYGQPQNPQDAYGSPGDAQPEDAYGSPETSPRPDDGMTEATTTEEADTEAVTEIFDESNASEPIPEERQSAKLKVSEDDEPSSEIYLVYTPHGYVQSLVHPGRDFNADINSAYTAQINYQRIQQPVFSYIPENYIYYEEVQK